jgi:orotidine-5'-phosphate decarboxylase
LGALGAKYLTMHARGGEDMLKAGVEGLNAGADAAGLDAPIGLAVTVLTSDSGAPAHIVPRRLRMAMESGCGGIVCAAEDLSDARTIAPRLVRVVPGIRPAGVPTDDQARSATPQEAFDGGADLLVIGRAVTNADDPEEAAAKLALSLT